jgi:hypothetical protein
MVFALGSVNFFWTIRLGFRSIPETCVKNATVKLVISGIRAPSARRQRATAQTFIIALADPMRRRDALTRASQQFRENPTKQEDAMT